MGLLCRILHRLYRIVSRIIQSCLIDDPDYEYNVLLVGLANFFIIIAIVGSMGIVLYMLVWAVSLAIFLDVLFIAYLSAWLWENLGKHFTSFEQEIYLIGSTVGHTVLFGTLIQIHRMQWADGKTLVVYWMFLLLLGFILWRVTVFNVARAPGGKPVLANKKIAYKHKFSLTKISKEIPHRNQAQAYLKKLK